MFPGDDEDCGPVGLNLVTFLNSGQLQYVEDLHIVMKLFWVPEDLQGAHKYRAHLHILQRVLNKLKEVEAGRDGPVLRSLVLEDLSNWRPNGRSNIKREKECLAQYEKMGQDAGIYPLQLKWPSGLVSTTRREVEDSVCVNVEKEDAEV